MVSFFSVLFAAALARGALTAPAAREPTEFSKRNSPNAEGTSGGYYYQFWDDGKSGNAVYTNGDRGEYSVKWANVGDFVSGKGWKQAEPRKITFSGTVQATGDFFLAVYTRSASGENYILEDYNGPSPCSIGTNQGTIYSDGSSYQYCLVDRGNNFVQNWSVRENKRSSGTVTTANHYNYYAAHGNHNPLSGAWYQIMSTEGYHSSGSATITVGEA